MNITLYKLVSLDVFGEPIAVVGTPIKKYIASVILKGPKRLLSYVNILFAITIKHHLLFVYVNLYPIYIYIYILYIIFRKQQLCFEGRTSWWHFGVCVGGGGYFVWNISNSKWTASNVKGIGQTILPDVLESSSWSLRKIKVMIDFIQRAKLSCAKNSMSACISFSE